MIKLNPEEVTQTLALNRKLSDVLIGHTPRVIIAALLNRLIAEEVAGAISREALDSFIAATREHIPAAREALNAANQPN